MVFFSSYVQRVTLTRTNLLCGGTLIHGWHWILQANLPIWCVTSLWTFILTGVRDTERAHPLCMYTDIDWGWYRVMTVSHLSTPHRAQHIETAVGVWVTGFVGGVGVRGSSLHDTFTQYWFVVGPASQTVGQQQTNIGSIFHVWRDLAPLV